MDVSPIGKEGTMTDYELQLCIRPYDVFQQVGVVTLSEVVGVFVVPRRANVAILVRHV